MKRFIAGLALMVSPIIVGYVYTIATYGWASVIKSLLFIGASLIVLLGTILMATAELE